MLNQSILAPHPGARRYKRSIGRGDSSGRGSYSGRGCKGQSSRSGGKVKPGFEGGQTPLLRRLPKFKGFMNPNRVSYQVVNLDALNGFDDGAVIDIVTLYEKKLISLKNRPVKVLGFGELKKKLTIKVDGCSASAKEKIEKAGGSVALSVKQKA